MYNNVEYEKPLPERSGKDSSGKKSRRYSLATSDIMSDHQPKLSKKHTAKGVFGDTAFQRLSFNINPNKKTDTKLINVPNLGGLYTQIDNDEYHGERRRSRVGSPDKNRRSSQGSK